MFVKVIDSFMTYDPPKINLPSNPFSGVTLTDKEQLNEDLVKQAQKIVSICACKIQEEGEDMPLESVKDVAKIIMDLKKAFTEEKSAININNIQQNISNTQLNMFKASLKSEI